MNYYELIKQELINNEIYKKVKDYSKNRSDLQTYYNVGKMLVEAQGVEERAKYGEQLIKKYSKKLTEELKHGYSIKNLKRMRQFYLFYQKGSTLSTQLTWSHYVELLSLTNISEINYYIDDCVKNNLSIRELRNKIKLNEYERLDNKTKLKLKNNNKLEVIDLVKNPIILNNNLNKEIIKEKALKKLILEDMDNFLKQLGSGFAYLENEYKIKVDKNYNYIDILLYNIKYKCYVVVELKVTTLKKEHIGQIMTYMNYIDKNIKSIDENNTIGIIITKKDNKYVMEYCSDERIFNTTYLLQEV